MGFFRQEYWSGLPCSPPGDLPNSGIELMIPVSPGLQADSSPTLGKPIQSFMSIQYWYELMNTYLILWVIIQYYFIYFADQIILTLIIRSSFKLTHESLWHASYFVFVHFLNFWFPGLPRVAQIVKGSASNVGDSGLIPGLGRSPGKENGNPLQYSCLENSMDGGAW